MADGRILVEVIYATTGDAIRRRLMVPVGSTVAQAIEASKIANVLPFDDSLSAIGVFGHKVSPNLILQDGDRIEIYRPLELSPMEARRRRAR